MTPKYRFKFPKKDNCLKYYFLNYLFIHAIVLLSCKKKIYFNLVLLINAYIFLNDMIYVLSIFNKVYIDVFLFFLSLNQIKILECCF